MSRLPERPRWLTDDAVRLIRWLAVAAWAGVFAAWVWNNGIPYFRTDLLLWLCPGLAAASIVSIFCASLACSAVR